MVVVIVALKIKGGVDELLKDVNVLTSQTKGILSEGVYEGAGLVYKAAKASAETIPTDERIYVREGTKKHGITSGQKASLIESLGIAPFESDNGEVQTKIGVDGYNSVVTRAWPKGQPNIIIARALINGTSWLRAYDFIGRARRQIKNEAERAMEDVVRRKIKDKTK